MPREFCEHLGDYSHNWIRAEAAYKAMGAAAGKLIAEGPTDDCLDLMEVTLRDWQFEVKHMRERFVVLVKCGVIELPSQGGDEEDTADTEACCAACGFEVPRLTWPDWKSCDTGSPAFRGTELNRNTVTAPA
ncbi:hypothetical protein DRQ50_11635 [bacterium]|nr:MAG: hypothetical protein DRQ50_11635 [bacterium]